MARLDGFSYSTGPDGSLIISPPYAKEALELLLYGGRATASPSRPKATKPEPPSPPTPTPATSPPTAGDPSAPKAWRGTIGELEDLQAEIDDDLTAGRLSPEAYQSANERIAGALKAATEPLPAGGDRKVRVVGIPRKEIDTDTIAMVYWMQAKRRLRERREKEAAEANDPSSTLEAQQG